MVALTLQRKPTTKHNLVVHPIVGQGLKPADRMIRHLENAHVHMMMSVAESTRATYATGFRKWQQFTVESGTTFDMAKFRWEWRHISVV